MEIIDKSITKKKKQVNLGNQGMYNNIVYKL